MIHLGFLQLGVYISVSYMTHLCPVIDIDRCSLHSGVQMNASYITGLWGSYDQGSYNQWFLQSGVLQSGVLTIRGPTTRGSYNQGSYNQGFLQPEVLTIRGSYN